MNTYKILPFIVLFLFVFKHQSLASNSKQDTLPPEIEAFVENEIEFKVPIITCQQLRKIQENGREKLAILDARSQKEFDVSHILDARRVGYDDFSSERVWFVDKKTIVVIYCREGKKSEKIGLELQKMGFKNIYNLYGSIIEWVNQDLPVVNKHGEPTQKVYTFTRKERKKLKKKPAQ